jgi:tetratricopeptide (TPR) repeat protein
MSRRTTNSRVRPRLISPRPSAGGAARAYHRRFAAVAAVAATLGLATAGSAADPPRSGPQPAARVAELIQAAEAKRAAGDDAGALDELRAANVIVKETRGPNHPDVLPILEAAARIFVESGRMAEAEKPLLKALAIYDQLAASGRLRQSADLAVCLLLLGKTHVALGRDEAAAACGDGAAAAGTADFTAGRPLIRSGIQELGRAIEIFSGLLGVDSEVTLASRQELAAAQAALGEVDAATALLRQVLATLGRGQAADPQVLAVTGEVAELLAERGWLADAITAESEALAAFESAGGDVESRIRGLRSLGELQLAAENFTPAEATFREAAELEAALGGQASAGAVLGRIDELRVRARRGDGDPAELDGLLAGLEGRPEAEAPFVAEALRGGARAALDFQDHARAADLARQACELDARAGSGAAPLAAGWACLGRALLAAGDATAARAAFELGLQESIRAVGPGHPRTLRMVVSLAEAAAVGGAADAARRLLEGIVGERLPRLAEREEEEICRAVDATARLLDRGGDPAEGEALRTALLDARRRQFGERHLHVASTLLHLATLRQRDKDHAAALPLYEAALAILEAAHGPQHPDVATVLTLLAQSQRAADDPAGAERSLARALGVWEGVVGPSHPVARQTVRSLALVRLALGKSREALPLMERLLAAYEADPTTDPVDIRRLLIKLAEVRQELGDAAAARALVTRAQELEIAATAVESPEERATDIAEIARLQQLLGDDFGAAANISRARTLVTGVEDPAAALKRIEAAVARRTEPRRVQASEPGRGRPAALDPATITAAIERARAAFRAGRRAEARGIVTAALVGVDRDGAEPAVADLLLASVEMRAATLQVDGAVGDCGQAIAIRARGLGPAHPATLAARLTLATLLYAKGNRAAAAAEIDAVAAKLGAAPAGPADVFRETARRSALVAFAAGDRKAVRQLFDCVLAVPPLPDGQAALAMLDTLGDLLDSGRSRAAAAIRQTLLDDTLRSLRPGDPEVPRFLVHKGLHAEQAGDPAAAEAAYREALSRDEALHGRDHPLVAADLLAVAGALVALARAAEAAPLLERARSISVGADRVSGQARDLRTLARGWSRAGYPAEAAEVGKAALAAQAAAGGSGLAEVLLDAAWIQLRAGNASRAISLFREATGLADAAEGPGGMTTVACAVALSRAVATDPISLARLLGLRQAIGAEPEAPAEPAAGSPAGGRTRPASDPILAIYGGDSDRRRGSGRGGHGLETGLPAATAAGDRPRPFVAASQSGLRLRTMFAKRRAVGAPPPPATADDLLRAAWSGHRAGDASAAASACDEAIAQVIREGGESDPRLDGVLADSAAIAFECGDFGRAMQLLERLGSFRWKAYGANDPRVAEAATALAAIAAECGEFQRAGRLCQQARATGASQAAPDPAAAAELELVEGRVALGQRNVAAAAAAAARTRIRIAAAWTAAAGVPAKELRVLQLRLGVARLLGDVGDPEAALEEIDQVLTAIGGGAAHSPRLIEAALAAATRTRVMAGDEAGAIATASQAVQMVQRAYRPSVATALQLVELALAGRAAGDVSWPRSAGEAEAILAAAADRMTPGDCDPGVIEALTRLGDAWIESGHTRQAAEAARAAERGTRALPATHPLARGVGRLAARLAIVRGDAALADSLLAGVAADPPVAGGLTALPAGAGQVFLIAAIGDVSTRDAVVRRRGKRAGGRPPGTTAPPPAGNPASR